MIPLSRGFSTRSLSLLIAIASGLASAMPPGLPNAPNLLWFIVDDMSPNFSCYGETLVETPHVDGLAREGTRFSRAYVTAPVCSPCRSALITGMYQTTIGAHQHRSGRGELKIRLPEGVEPIPAILQRAGYYTCIGEWFTRRIRLRKGWQRRQGQRKRPRQDGLQFRNRSGDSTTAPTGRDGRRTSPSSCRCNCRAGNCARA